MTGQENHTLLHWHFYHTHTLQITTNKITKNPISQTNPSSSTLQKSYDTVILRSSLALYKRQVYFSKNIQKCVKKQSKIKIRHKTTMNLKLLTLLPILISLSHSTPRKWTLQDLRNYTPNNDSTIFHPLSSEMANYINYEIKPLWKVSTQTN